jgi:uroporphyrin-III C-methyltransferase
MEYSLNSRGKVYICGAGPGEPELLTLKAKRLLKTCDVILYDRLVTKDILDLVPVSARKIYVGRKSGDPTINQKRTNNLMLSLAGAGKKILRLKGGDPFIFGRGGEEVEFLSSHGIEIEVVPGVSSFSAAAVYARMPLTYREISSSVALVTGHEDPNKKGSRVKWKKLAKSVDTIVVLMGIERLENISEELISGGLSSKTPVGIIENATTSKQRIILGELHNVASKIKEYSVQSPSIIIIGKVVMALNLMD